MPGAGSLDDGLRQGEAVVAGDGPAAHRLDGLSPERRGFADVKAGQEACEAVFRVCARQLDQLPQEGPRPRQLQGLGGGAGMYRLRVARQAVGEVGQVLAAQDLLGAEIRGRRSDRTVDQRKGIAQLRQHLAAAAGEGDVQGIAGQASRAANALHVVGDTTGQRRQENR